MTRRRLTLHAALAALTLTSMAIGFAGAIGAALFMAAHTNQDLSDTARIAVAAVAAVIGMAATDGLLSIALDPIADRLNAALALEDATETGAES